MTKAFAYGELVLSRAIRKPRNVNVGRVDYVYAELQMSIPDLKTVSFSVGGAKAGRSKPDVGCLQFCSRDREIFDNSFLHRFAVTSVRSCLDTTPAVYIAAIAPKGNRKENPIHLAMLLPYLHPLYLL